MRKQPINVFLSYSYSHSPLSLPPPQKKGKKCPWMRIEKLNLQDVFSTRIQELFNRVSPVQVTVISTHYSNIERILLLECGRQKMEMRPKRQRSWNVLKLFLMDILTFSVNHPQNVFRHKRYKDRKIMFYPFLLILKVLTIIQ